MSFHAFIQTLSDFVDTVKPFIDIPPDPEKVHIIRMPPAGTGKSAMMEQLIDQTVRNAAGKESVTLLHIQRMRRDVDRWRETYMNAGAVVVQRIPKPETVNWKKEGF